MMNSYKFGYVLAISNLRLYRKNCDYMLNTFYRDTSKSLELVLMYVPLSIRLCDNNIGTRTGLITSF